MQERQDQLQSGDIFCHVEFPCGLAKTLSCDGFALSTPKQYKQELNGPVKQRLVA
jgi:hypothetical protein